MLSVTCLRNHDDLSSLQADWQRLAAGSLFSDWAWLVNWANNYVPAHELCVLVARDDTQGVAAILPLYREVSLVRGRTLRFLGSGKVCTEYQTVLSTNDVTLAEPAVRAIGDWLSQTSAQSEIEWDLMELESTSPDDMAMGWLMHELGQRGLSVQSHAAPCCWKVALKPTWDEYLEGLDKNVRRKIRKLVRDYVDTGRAELLVCESSDERQVAMQHLIDFHQRRLQDAGVEGCFSQPEFGQFLRQAVEELASTGRVWLGQLSVDHQPVSVSLFLRYAASAFALHPCRINIDSPQPPPCPPPPLRFRRTPFRRRRQSRRYLPRSQERRHRNRRRS